MTLSKLEIDQLLIDYVDSIEAHGKANEKNDTEMASQCAKLRMEIYRRLKRDGHDALIAFFALLKHPGPDVRGSVAGFGLEFATPRERSMLGFGRTHRRWRTEVKLGYSCGKVK